MSLSIQDLLAEIRCALNESFSDASHWFDIPADVLRYRPASGGWTIAEVLEHISLTNHFLLILIEKGKDKALANIQSMNLAEELAAYEFRRDGLDEVGLHKSFDWIRPEHHQPSGNVTLAEVRKKLAVQLQQCLAVLDALPNGEGVLYRTTLNVNNLGKTDVYEYLYFLAQHVRRHITQMQKVKTEYDAVFG